MKRQNKIYLILAGLVLTIFVQALIERYQLIYLLAGGEIHRFTGSFQGMQEVKLAKSYSGPHVKIIMDFEAFPFKDGYQNILQTANNNDGIRVEIAGASSAIGLVYATNVPGKTLMGISLDKKVIFNNPLHLEIESAQDRWISITDAVGKTYRNNTPVPFIKADRVLFNQGYDDTRTFKGITHLFSFAICQESRYVRLMIAVYGVMGLMWLGLIVTLKRRPTKP